MNNKKKGLILSILGIIGLVVITVGVTYAFFNYAKEGTTENSITTGSITFIYEEVEAQGAGISIEDVFPVSDTVGKAQSGSGKVFNFKVKSKTMNTASIPYTVTARMKADSTLDQSAVKMYLTEVSGENETEVLLNTYDKLDQTSIDVPEGTVEKVIYTDTVPTNSSNYEKNFRLRMWIPDTIDFSPVKDESGNDTYPYNGKKFTVTVNVYANAEVVTTPETPTYTAYSIGDEITLTDGSKWHVLENSDETEGAVVLLSDYNLNSDGSYNTECGRDINSVYKCSPMSFDPNNTQNYDENDGNNIGYFIKNTYVPLVTASLPNTTNVTIPTADQIANVDSIEFSSNSSSAFSLTSSWLLTTNYWTMTVRTTYSNHLWLVSGLISSLTSSSAYDSEYSGVRPVITTPKANIVKTMKSDTVLQIGTSVEAVDGSKWHVLEASGNDSKYVTLLSDYNLNSDGSYNTECHKSTGLNDCVYMVFDSDNINIYDETDSNNIGYFIKNTYSPLVTKKLFETTNVTIPTAEQVALADNKTNFDSSLTSNFSLTTDTWLTTTSYWTKTPHNANNIWVWDIGAGSSVLSYTGANFATGLSVRPVITTPKTNLLAK